MKNKWSHAAMANYQILQKESLMMKIFFFLDNLKMKLIHLNITA